MGDISLYDMETALADCAEEVPWVGGAALTLAETTIAVAFGVTPSRVSRDVETMLRNRGVNLEDRI